MPPQRVLIVDDDPEIRESMRMVLEDEGYQVREASDGVAALDELHRDRSPWVVLLDLMMPRMNGWEFLGAAARDPKVGPIEIVIVSAHPPTQNPEGVRGVLRKPYSVDKLLDAVESCAS